MSPGAMDALGGVGGPEARGRGGGPKAVAVESRDWRGGSRRRERRRAPDEVARDAGVDDDGRGGGAGASGAPSVRTAEPERPRGGADGASKSPKAPSSSSAPSSETPSARPKRRRGRPVSRKPAKAPVPGDAMGVASLLWQLAREDEQILGRARIQPHGLEAVVPARDPTSSRASSSREPLRSTSARTKIDLDELAALVAAGRSTADIAARFGVTRAAVRKATARLPRRPGDEAAGGDSPGGDSPGASDGRDADDDGSRHERAPVQTRGAAQERGRGRGTTRDGRETRGGGQDLGHSPANKLHGSRAVESREGEGHRGQDRGGGRGGG